METILLADPAQTIDTVDRQLWREAMGGFPTGVTIVTTHDDSGAPAGTAVNAFCAVSMDPPLLLICLDKQSRTLAALRAANTFCVNILSDRHQQIVRAFASKSETDRFRGVAHAATEAGDPILDNAVAWFDCTVEEIHDGGDHEIVVGRVVELGADKDAAPLAYHRGRVWPLYPDASGDATS